MSATGERLSPLDMLARLVSFDTESDKSNLALIDAVSAYLDGWDVPYLRLPNAAGDKAAILATVGPMVDGGVVLSGHTDVVPVTGQAWTSDPFTLRVADGRAYGRGAVDMKGFDALALALVPDMIAAGLKRPIHILLSYDEETTCLGSMDGIARFGDGLPRPAAVIVGEPTGMEVADAHKSIVTCLTTVHGHEAHSARPALGANAVSAACDLVAGLNRIADLMIERGDPSGRFDPASTTVHVGTIQGGTARNILAKECRFLWEYRGLPDLDPAEIPRLFAAEVERVTRERLNRYGAYGRIETLEEVDIPGLAPEPGSEAERLCLRLAGRNRTVAVPYATEAGRFQAAGLPTVVCGPGDIAQAHQPDEFITLDALGQGEHFLRKLIEVGAS
ncbi:acetylornithine deacetylase [Methylobacterium sp. PvP062]|jgi:acetylornithine deacetylase|uniref:Acetylornithine deacetylase (ArgE) n=2 Tax=Methylobacterium radiotolerans TaxID=31998 RepID=B1LXV1_METRJ|nr:MULTISPECIES: acetylornithine deacetylase [Methylobacterium]MCX7331257.1 acetylornithine deacetylase [Hyphomicrobiales bacterium]GAN49562.1 acetylornithine deacetylase [Methylobacterium sp. ME121]ACB24308.1 acetylornithine deacetylase (ArgE) [Methylobacterium radiotolerans JCM 2831]KIU34065.1 acetylornithine deacetylase [Methylobacterium radiotolerans]KTS12691.1 acetylornithine deacetylase [Methylobacterium radiotolerans]